MLIDVEVLVSREKEDDYEELEELGLEVEGNKNVKEKRKYRGMNINPDNVMLIQNHIEGHTLIAFDVIDPNTASFKSIAVKGERDSIRAKMNKAMS